MKKLVILDYCTGKVHIYNIERDVDAEYIVNIGYKLDSCEWIVGDLEILFHKGTLL